MMAIKVKKHREYKYKGLTIGIWHTRNKKFIKSTSAAKYIAEDYLIEKNKKVWKGAKGDYCDYVFPKKNFTGLYFADHTFPFGTSGRGIFSSNILNSDGFFEFTEAGAIRDGKIQIDKYLKLIGMEFIDRNLPTHVYDPKNGLVLERWCDIDDHPVILQR